MNLKKYQEVKSLNLDDVVKVCFNKTHAEQIQTILDIALDWSTTNSSDTPWDFDFKGPHWDKFGKACRKASILTHWAMAQDIRKINNQNFEEGYANYQTNLAAVDLDNLNRICVASIEQTALAYANDDNYGVSFEEMLNESAVKRGKMTRQQTWQLGNQYAEVMGVKIPDPDQVRKRKNKRNSARVF